MTYELRLPQVFGNPDIQEGQGDSVQLFINTWLGRLGERAALMRPDPRLVGWLWIAMAVLAACMRSSQISRERGE